MPKACGTLTPHRVIPSHLDAIYGHEQLIEHERADQAKRWKADGSGEPPLAVRDAGSSIEEGRRDGHHHEKGAVRWQRAR